MDEIIGTWVKSKNVNSIIGLESSHTPIRTSQGPHPPRTAGCLGSPKLQSRSNLGSAIHVTLRKWLHLSEPQYKIGSVYSYAHSLSQSSEILHEECLTCYLTQGRGSIYLHISETIVGSRQLIPLLSLIEVSTICPSWLLPNSVSLSCPS